MRYGRTAGGVRWHAVVDDHAMCTDVAGRLPLVDIRDGSDPAVTRDDICGNCNTMFRRKGSKARQAKSKADRARKDVYKPRHQFDDP